VRGLVIAGLLGVLVPACDLVFSLEQGDSDGDGIDDGIDNCPGVANADQHDEDADGIGDRCDNCPQRPDVDGPGPNTDGDDLGDRCDDQPTRIDCIALFDGFGFPNPNNWDLTASTGTWSVDDDTMFQEDSTRDAIFVSQETYSAPSIEVRAAATTLGVLPLGVGVWGWYDGQQGLTAEAISRPGPDFVIVGITARMPNANNLGTSYLEPQQTLATAAPIGVTFDLETPGLVSAAAEVGLSTGAYETQFSIPAGPNHVALRTSNAAARFEYILVVEHPAALPCPPR